MDIGNIWNSLYTSQLMGTQMYGLQADPFQTYGSYADVWQNNWFMDTLSNALTKYNEGLRNTDSIKVGKDVDVSTHEGNVWQLGYDKALVYLPEEQKLMVVQTGGTEQSEKKGIMVNQRKARASAAYRKTQRAGQTDSLWAKKRTGT